MIPVFVYGTLLVGEANHHVVAPYVLSVQSGAVQGLLYDAGSYPALVLSGEHGESLVEGQWLMVTKEGLERMDELEEYYGPGKVNDYERVWIRDMLNGEREGWVYVWTDSRNCRLISRGSWRKHIREKQKKPNRCRLSL